MAVLPVLPVSFNHNARDCMSSISVLKNCLMKTNCNINVNFSMFNSSVLLLWIHIMRCL